jgi:hypothetical protein
MLLADVGLNPTVNALPGSAALLQITNGIAAWALIGSLVALLLGAALWATPRTCITRRRVGVRC